jgi:hypothetical protein
MSEPRRPSVGPTRDASQDPRAQAVSTALDRARAARLELEEMRIRREAAVKRADKAMKALREPEPPPKAAVDRVQDALDNIARVTRIPTPGDK